MASRDNRPLLRDPEAAAYIKMSVSWLRQSRLRGYSKGGPKFIKMNKAVRYDPKDLDDWIESKGRTPERAA